MKVIALTGASIHGQASVTELVLDITARAGIQLFVAMYCDSPEQIRAMRKHNELLKLWAVGTPSADMAALVDASIPTSDQPGMATAIRAELATLFPAWFKASTTNPVPETTA